TRLPSGILKLRSCSRSFVWHGIACVHSLKIPAVLLACKSDVESKQIDPRTASTLSKKYQIGGLIEVATSHDSGKRKMRDSFTWMMKELSDPGGGTCQTRCKYA